MGKIKNFRVNLPYEYARDKKWIDENIKPGDVDEYRVYKGSFQLHGSLKIPEELFHVLDHLEENQDRIQRQLNRLFSLFQEAGDSSPSSFR